MKVSVCRTNSKVDYLLKGGDMTVVPNKPRHRESKVEQERLRTLFKRMDEADKLIKDVESKASVLPPVDENGTSECPGGFNSQA